MLDHAELLEVLEVAVDRDAVQLSLRPPLPSAMYSADTGPSAANSASSTARREA